jgi:DNA-binding transcriptional regulator YdaS (Cro superfamily)
MLKIIERAANEAGGLLKLAKSLGVKHQTFYSWRRIPAERVLAIETLTGISRHELRPDLYPRERERA